MLITIGICDDCPEQIELIRRYLCGYEGGCRLTVISAVDPEEFLAQIKVNKPELVFLDIDMGSEMSGIQ